MIKFQKKKKNAKKIELKPSAHWGILNEMKLKPSAHWGILNEIKLEPSAHWRI
jgi:hypothetical protein